MLRLYRTHYVPPQFHITRPAPGHQLFNEETWLPHPLTPLSFHTFQKWGPYFSMAFIMPTAVAERGALAFRFNPNRPREAVAAGTFLTLLSTRLFGGTVVPYSLSRDILHDQATWLYFGNLWSAQYTPCCICFQFFGSFPFPLILDALDCKAQWSAAQKLWHVFLFSRVVLFKH